MNVKKTQEILQNFYETNKEKSILIEGPHGVGKTYAIKEFISTKKRQKITLYLSLYGLNSIEKINEELQRVYLGNHKFVKNFKKFGGILSSITAHFKKSDQIVFELQNALGLFDNQKKFKPKKGQIIIFDDLDRLSKNIPYDDFLGFLNGLFVAGIKVICLSSSKNIEWHENINKEQILDFEEKCFDRKCVINEIDDEIIRTLMKDSNIDFSNELKEIFGYNLRILKKVIRFYNEIKSKYILEEDKKFVNYTDKEIFKACLYTILIVSYFFEKKEYVDEKGKKCYEDAGRYFSDKNIVRGITYYTSECEKSKKDFTEYSELKNLIMALIKVYLSDDVSLLNAYVINKNVDDRNSILNTKFNLLSDENGAKFLTEIKERILDKKIIINDTFFLNLLPPLIDSDEKIGEEMFIKIAEMVDEQVGLKNLNGFLDSYVKIQSQAECKFVEKLKNAGEEMQKNKIYKAFFAANSENDYGEMTRLLCTLLEENFKGENREFIIGLQEKDYCLPDLAGDLTKDSLSYCKELTKFVKRENAVEGFKKFLMQSKKENKNSKVAVERV